MSKRLIVAIAAFGAAAVCSSLLHAQDAKWNNIPPGRAAYKDKKPMGDPPRRNLTGIWDTVQALGTSGAPEHPATFPGYDRSKGGAPDETGISKPLPYTAAGLAALKKNLPSGPGVRQVDSVLTNDPAGKCDPLGFPYMFSWEYRTINVVQTPKQMIMLSPFYGNYRVIWTDGRTPPKDPDPRYNGYSVGHWEDDYTFVVNTIGSDERSWLDNAGNPHSADLKVEERYHRVNHDVMEMTVTIDDAKAYTRPWTPRNRMRLTLAPAGFDMMEMICSPTEVMDFRRNINDRTVNK